MPPRAIPAGPGFVVAAATLLLTACAAAPPASQPVAGTPAAAAATTAPTDARSQTARLALAEGYRRVTRNGQELFCRADTVLGTKLRQDVCYTEAQLENARRNSEEFMHAVQGAIGADNSPPRGPLDR